MRRSAMLCLLSLVAIGADDAKEDGFTPLFSGEGAPKGWRVSTWDDVSKPAPADAVWKVENGVLHGFESSLFGSARCDCLTITRRVGNKIW